ncbi:MAG: hypothetical protein A2Y33_07755 [Spirochaetes bacterium GWF1_51_8]|nr:MAG: hypothetical protein A2Y33_07755 [Spirochaetes bacterium GWF1_51_8]
MKRFAVVLGLIVCAGAYTFAETNAQSFMDYMQGTYQEIATALSTPMAPTMTIYNSAGSVYPSDVRDFLGIKIGIGVGVVASPSLSKYILSGLQTDYMPATASGNSNSSIYSSMVGAFSLVPMPYTMLYAKLGMIKLPILPQFDLGVRIGYLPDVGPMLGYTENNPANTNNIIAKTGAFHIGAEARSKIIDAGIFQIGLNLSVDFDSGGIEFSQYFIQPLEVPVPGGSGFNQTIDTKYTTGINFGWMGTSVGGKLIASLNIPILSLYAGVGVNFNVGSVTSKMYTKGEMIVVTETEFFNVEGVSTIPYYFTEIRVLAGFQLLIINAALEYSVNTGAIAVTIHPITLTF